MLLFSVVLIAFGLESFLLAPPAWAMSCSHLVGEPPGNKVIDLKPRLSKNMPFSRIANTKQDSEQTADVVSFPWSLDRDARIKRGEIAQGILHEISQFNSLLEDVARPGAPPLSEKESKTLSFRFSVMSYFIEYLFIPDSDGQTPYKGVLGCKSKARYSDHIW